MPGQHLVSHEKPQWPIFFQHSLKLPVPRAANHYHEKRWECWFAPWKLTDPQRASRHRRSFFFPLLWCSEEKIVPIYTDVCKTPISNTLHFNSVGGLSWQYYKVILLTINSITQVKIHGTTRCNFKYTTSVLQSATGKSSTASTFCSHKAEVWHPGGCHGTSNQMLHTESPKCALCTGNSRTACASTLKCILPQEIILDLSKFH